jgi:hypothetical protein
MSRQSRKAQIGNAHLPSRAFSLVAGTAPLANRSAGNHINDAILTRRIEIPIARGSALTQHPAGSFPDGFRTTAPVPSIAS